MHIETRDVHGIIIVRPTGRVDSSTSGALEQMLKAEAARHLLLDLSQVAYMSSAGLRVVLLAAKAARSEGGSFAVFGMNASVKTVFELSGFDRIVSVAATESDALAMSAG